MQKPVCRRTLLGEIYIIHHFGIFKKKTLFAAGLPDGLFSNQKSKFG
jgi:hypothetical protein